MRRAGGAVAAFGALAAALLHAGPARADLTHETVDDGGIEVLDLTGPDGKTESVAFAELGRPRATGTWVLHVTASGDVLRAPHCNGRGKITVDGKERDAGSKGVRLLQLAVPGEPMIPDSGGHAGLHDIRIAITVSAYEKRIACGERIRVGPLGRTAEGLATFRFASPARGPYAGEAVVFVPRGHDAKKPAALLVGLHPWNGDPWTYAAYRELLEEAQAKDVVLLMPSGLGNSLYTAEAEAEVMRAIAAFEKELAIDPARISLWGASMGGAGATTVGLHHPDRFAFVASWFGDSKYDLTTYVRSLIPDEAAARKVNALDVVENARHLPVWLIHGEDDRTSPIAQSVMLHQAMKQRGFAVDFDRVPGMGHEGPLVARFLRKMVGRAADARAPKSPSRVSFRSVRPADAGAYGVRIATRTRPDGEAYVDIEKQADGVHVLPDTKGVTEIVLTEGALGAKPGEPVTIEGARATKVSVRWD